MMKTMQRALAFFLLCAPALAWAQAQDEDDIPSATAPLNEPASTPPTPTALTLSSSNETARSSALDCAAALDNFHPAAAREKCTAAITQDPNLAIAHLWLSQAAATPAQAAAELSVASALAAQASPGERLLIQAWRAWREARILDARTTYDELTRILPGEKRAFLSRGQFRQLALGAAMDAAADFQKAITLDERYSAAYNFLAFALADQGKLAEAVDAIRKYLELAPRDPNAHDSLAALALRRGDSQLALNEARSALAMDSHFTIAHSTLGDVFLLQGKFKEARLEYSFLEQASEASWRHYGSMCLARSFLFEGRPLETEKLLLKEAGAAQTALRVNDALETLLALAEVQLDQEALAAAGRSLKQIEELLRADKSPTSKVVLGEIERRMRSMELTTLRAKLLSLVGERALAEARADELITQLQGMSLNNAEQRAGNLRGWIAWRSGDPKAAVELLDKAITPNMRLALADALSQVGQYERARSLMDDLARRPACDLETALTRPRALAWLKANQTKNAVLNGNIHSKIKH